MVWDFGSAARHHQLYNPWLDHTDGPPTPEGARATGARAGISTLRGALHPDAGMAADVAAKVAGVLHEHGLAGEPVGVDVAEMPVLAALRAAGHRDGRRPAGLPGGAGGPRPRDEISLLSQACAMVDAAYQQLYEFLRPGVRENECVGLVAKALYDLGSEFVEGVNAISGERCSPHPHVYSDRLIRPGDPAFFDILHSYLGYRTCYYRTFAVGSASRAQRDAYVRCREYMDQAIAMVRPGVTTGDIVSLWPRAEEFGFPDEMAAFALQYGHGVGLSIWEKPIFSRLVSLDHPEPLEEGMVFALETYWPAADGWSAARIEEEVVVTADGCEVITKFPAEELLVAGPEVLDRRRRAGHAAGEPVQPQHRGRARRERRRSRTAGAGRDGRRQRMPEVTQPATMDARRTARRGSSRWPSSAARRRRRMTCSWPGWSRARRTWRPGTRRSRSAPARRCGPMITSSPPTAVITTRWPAARRPTECLAELMSKATGVCKAKGGSMHLTKASAGMLGSYAIVGAHLPMAAGAAWSAQLRGSGQVAVAFFGDGATNIGAFHEALNLASVWSLPVLFICENNLYMEYTPIGSVTAAEHPAADRAAGLPAAGGGHRRQRRRRRGRRGRPGRRAGPGRRRPDRARGADLPALRPQPHRPGQLPASRRGRASG